MVNHPYLSPLLGAEPEPAHYLWDGARLYCDSAYLRRCALEHLGFGDFCTIADPKIVFIRWDEEQAAPPAFIGRIHRVIEPTTAALRTLHDLVLATGNVHDCTEKKEHPDEAAGDDALLADELHPGHPSNYGDR